MGANPMNTQIHDYFSQMKPPHFLVIAGPCSLETEDQFLKTAHAVRDSGASMLRGGVWKMRTSAKNFQGLGASGLEIAKAVKQKSGMGLVTEITDVRQIESLGEIVDVFQVGSRNMHNYSLLAELGKQQKPVLLKRGFGALIEEWIKAAEYIEAGGNQKIILCERGIRTFEKATRNTLDINAVVYAKKHTPYPVIVDPSHAVGIRDLVPQVALSAVAAGADGLIVEVHPDPDRALSDGQQTLNFNQFADLMTRIKRLLPAIDKNLLDKNLLDKKLFSPS
jgi:3-deoxy-7-phosphoheptulonate synthase